MNKGLLREKLNFLELHRFFLINLGLIFLWIGCWSRPKGMFLCSYSRNHFFLGLIHKNLWENIFLKNRVFDISVPHFTNTPVILDSKDIQIQNLINMNLKLMERINFLKLRVKDLENRISKPA